MSGITRISISSSWDKKNDWRLRLSQDHAHVADEIYRQVFSLADGSETITAPLGSRMARYDKDDGIDVILTTRDGSRFTIQEKFLTFPHSTITIEDEKTNGNKGAWYYCIAQYYFIGYTRHYGYYQDDKFTIYDNPVIDFQDWVLVDFPAFKRLEYNLDWQWKQNNKDGREASFRYIHFNDIPSSCIVAMSGYGNGFNLGHAHANIIIRMTNDQVDINRRYNQAMHILQSNTGEDRFRFVFLWPDGKSTFGNNGRTRITPNLTQQLIQLLGKRNINTWQSITLDQ